MEVATYELWDISLHGFNKVDLAMWSVWSITFTLMQLAEMACYVPQTRCLSGRLTNPLHAIHMTPLLALGHWV